jgi:hypothetical protein
VNVSPRRYRMGNVQGPRFGFNRKNQNAVVIELWPTTVAALFEFGKLRSLFHLNTTPCRIDYVHRWSVSLYLRKNVDCDLPFYMDFIGCTFRSQASLIRGQLSKRKSSYHAPRGKSEDDATTMAAVAIKPLATTGATTPATEYEVANSMPFQPKPR